MDHPRDGCCRHQLSPQWALLPRVLGIPSTPLSDSLASSEEAAPLSSPVEIESPGRSMVLNIPRQQHPLSPPTLLCGGSRTSSGTQRPILFFLDRRGASSWSQERWIHSSLE